MFLFRSVQVYVLDRISQVYVLDYISTGLCSLPRMCLCRAAASCAQWLSGALRAQRPNVAVNHYGSQSMGMEQSEDRGDLLTT